MIAKQGGNFKGYLDWRKSLIYKEIINKRGVFKMDKLSIVILAAGMGKRMKSSTPKALHRIAGRPLIFYSVEKAVMMNPDDIVVVINPYMEKVKEILSSYGMLKYVVQDPPLGTGHAVYCVKGHLDITNSDIIILYADVPFVRIETLKRLVESHRINNKSVTLLTASVRDPAGYGRVVRDEKGCVKGIIEESDAADNIRMIKEINTGIMIAKGKFLFSSLERIGCKNAQGEYYLPEIVRIAYEEGAVNAINIEGEEEIKGINTMEDLANAEIYLRYQINRKHMLNGVRIIDPRNTFIDESVEIGNGTLIYPFSIIEGETKIGSNCIIGQGVRIKDCRIENDVIVKPYCVMEMAILRRGVQIGPFAHLRPETELKEEVRIGNFVEVKKSTLGRKTKANHLAYIGDATVGEEVNIGAGTITCNYDGEKKNPTFIEDSVFVGTNVSLVAPVRLGKGCYIGAGSIITKDVPPGALGIARERQKNIEGWVEKKRKKGGG